MNNPDPFAGEGGHSISTLQISLRPAKIISHVVGCLFVVAFASFSAGCKEAPKTTARPPEPVKVASVVQKDVPIYGEWVGTTVGFVTAQIRARVSGYLISQNYKEGTLVKTGDLLFQIDPRTYQNAANQARAQLRTAESQLEQAKAAVAQNEADVAKAEANQKKTELEVARYTPLAGRGSVSQQELDNTVQNNEANLAAVLAARANVANAKAGVAKAQAEIARAQATLDEALLNLSWTKVTSPINGIAGIKNADIGDSIATNTVLTTVSQVNPLYVQVGIAEQEYLRWRQRPAAAADVDRKSDLELILSDGTIFPQRGTVEIVDRQIGVTTGTISVRGVFPNPGDLLRPGQFAKVRAVIDTKKGALLIPQRAVRDVQGLHEVGVVGGGDTVELRKVEVAERVGPLWIISQGLKPDERVITEGLDKVRAGEKVKALPADPEPASAKPQPGAAPIVPPAAPPASPPTGQPRAPATGSQPK
jgi:membrane fusion protein, multidrug efflux system